MKNTPFLPNPYETWGKYSPHEAIIFPKFHKNWAKILNFLLGHSDFRINFLIRLLLYLLSKINEITLRSIWEKWIKNMIEHIVLILILV